MAQKNDDSSAANKALVNALLKGMNNLKDVFVIICTNRPWDLDQAFRRRLGSMVLVDLPSKSDRALLFRYHLKTKLHVVVKQQIMKLAENTEGYSGSDIENLVTAALQLALTRTQEAKYCIKTPKYVYPVNESVADAIEMTEDSIKGQT